MKFFPPHLAILLLLFGCSLKAADSPPLRSKTNEVSILFYSPQAIPLKALKEKAPFHASITYALEFADAATIHLEINSARSDVFEPVAEAEIKRGKGTVMLTGWGMPRNWGYAHPFSLRARLVPKTSSPSATELVSKAEPIFIGDIADRATDGVLILGTQPERLVRDVEQEVSVLVSYDLKTTEKATLYLGFNAHNPKGYIIFSNKEITRGKGEVVLTARVTPKFWGDLTFFSAYVNLSEVDHAGQWSPKAGDSEPIELAPPEAP